MASQKPTTTRSALADELILYTTKQEGIVDSTDNWYRTVWFTTPYVGEKVGFSYEAECTALKSVTLTLNFDGSANFAIDDYGGNVLSESAGNIPLFLYNCLQNRLSKNCLNRKTVPESSHSPIHQTFYGAFSYSWQIQKGVT